MQVLPVDLTAITAIVMSMLSVLIPIAGLTLRFAIKPITESLARLRESGMEREKVQLLERRVALLEQEVHSIDTMKRDLASALEAADFQRQLRTPAQPVNR